MVVRDVLGWPAQRWMATAVGVLLTGLVVGVPTAVIPNPVFTRMTAVTWWSWPVWAVTAVLSGLVLATYVRTPDNGSRGGRAGAGGGILSVLAVGCPICNKLIVGVLGVAGAMQWWAPLQPLLGAASVGLLVVAFCSRLRGERMCAIPVVPATR